MASMISANDTKAILRILADALPDAGQDLLTSVQIAEDQAGHRAVRLETRAYGVISGLRGDGGIEDQILEATHRPDKFFSLHGV